MAAKSRRRAYEIPTRDDLLCMAMEIYDFAMEKTHMQRDGNEAPCPELSSATKAVELMGRLIGVLGDGRTMDKAQLERELDRLGYELRPKALKATGT